MPSILLIFVGIIATLALLLVLALAAYWTLELNQLIQPIQSQRAEQFSVLPNTQKRTQQKPQHP